MKKLNADDQVIYIGKSVRVFGQELTSDTVYIGGYPPVYEKLVEAVPLADKLFVMLDEYVEAKKKLSEVGTLESIAVDAVFAFYKDGVRVKKDDDVIIKDESLGDSTIELKKKGGVK